jgi:ABC-2 type transport system ATP-binding protein
MESQVAQGAPNKLDSILKEDPMLISSTSTTHDVAHHTIQAQLPAPAQWAGIDYSYDGKTTALKDFSLSLEPGETLALLGPNGAGKSTAIKLLLGLLPSQAGQVAIFNADPRLSSARAKLGAVLQTSGLPSQLTVLEQLRLQASYYRDALNPVELLQELNLLTLKDRRTNALSGGERRRLEFAMALVGQPQLLVLDEPTAGVDINERAHLVSLLSNLKRQGMTILLTTHLIEEAERLADRVAYLETGKLQFLGRVAQLQARSGQSVLRFQTTLAEPALRSVVAQSSLDASTLSTITASDYQLEHRNPSEFLRALFVADAQAKVLSLSAVRLEDALRQLSHSAIH